MAGDWIKMRCNLWDDPRVARLCDLTDCGEAAIVGGLYWLWSAADQHSEDGLMPGLTRKSIDRKTGIQGFGDALESIGWVSFSDDGAGIVRFDEHNGKSAKRRCSESVRKMSARHADKSETNEGQKPDKPQQSCAPREREEKSKPPISEQTTSTTITCYPEPEIPLSSSLSDFDARAKAMAARLAKREAARGARVVATASDRRIVAWAQAGLTDSQFSEAYDMAMAQRESDRSNQPINVGFLDLFVAKILNPSDAPSSVSGVIKAWHETASGIEAKGKELGIPPPSAATGGFPAFKARVFKAAGMAIEAAA